MKHLSRTLFAMLSLLVIAACSTPTKTALQAQLSGRPPDYRDGYISGCNYGQAEASHARNDGSRDENRFREQQDYARGWYEGNEACRDSYHPSTEDRRHDPTKPVRTEGGW